MKVVLVTGGFDPLHQGHIQYLKEAGSLGDILVVGLNSDQWLTKKKGRPFMSWDDRFAVVSNLKGVDWVIEFDDSDGTAVDAIRKVKEKYPGDAIVFANGGDRTAINTPEISEPNVLFKFGVGGTDKLNASSKLLDDWVQFKS